MNLISANARTHHLRKHISRFLVKRNQGFAINAANHGLGIIKFKFGDAMTPTDLGRWREMFARETRHKYDLGDYWNALESAVDRVEELQNEVFRLEIPYCLGAHTISLLAEEGQAVVSGRAFIAASDLYKKDPYQRISRLREALEEIREKNQCYRRLDCPHCIARKALENDK